MESIVQSAQTSERPHPDEDDLMIAQAMRRVLTIYDDIERNGLQETPMRVAKMYRELLTCTDFTFTMFPAEGADQMIVERGIQFYSLCEHHLIPFFGTATIAYIPDAHIAGLSKLARTVTYFSHALQTQERLTNQIADYLLDMIYTLQGADCTCCLAVQAGLKYGIQSASYSLCPYVDKLSGRHTVTFIDNDYFHYDHAQHLAVVTQLRPKYATVRDVMTQAQCVEAGIDYYPLAQILTWAEELATYAENVIIIPKYDCIDQIPAQFMLGYSIPTSHGGTPLPVERFKGRRVHLLGGSWTAQLTYMAAMGEDVVSVDNNMVALLASRYGLFVTPDGENTSLSDIGLGKLNNPRYAALALSFGAIGAKVQELFGVPQHDEFDDLGSDDPSTNISA